MWNFRKPMSIFGNSLRQILLDWRTLQGPVSFDHYVPKRLIFNPLVTHS